MEPEEETLATIPEEEEEDGDTAMPDVKNNPKPATKANSSDSSDASNSDSDSDSEDEAKQSMELQILEYQLSNEPSSYDIHVQYIRKLCEIQKLRQAREAMNEIFPLTPAMWQEFARDEASISTGLRLFWELRRFTKEEFLIICLSPFGVII